MGGKTDRRGSASFFASLPADELTPVELALRHALIDAVSAHPGPFPLVEWIDRRVGGELETRRGENGLFDVMKRGQFGPPPKEREAPSERGPGRGGDATAFFATVPKGSFLPTEEALRESIFEFLATWTSPELATMSDLSVHPSVQRCRGELLPKRVPLKEWIERRIGGEIEFKKDGNTDVIHVTPAAQPLVAQKFKQLQRAGGGSPRAAGPPGKDVDMGARGPPMKAGNGVAREPMSKEMGDELKEQFFASLPKGDFLEEEEALRGALIAFLESWQGSGPPTLSNAGPNRDIMRAKKAVLPSHGKVSLLEWIDRRIGGEIETAMDTTGQIAFGYRGKLRGVKRRKVSET